VNATWLLPAQSLAQSDLGRSFDAWTRRSGSMREIGMLLAVILAVALVWAALSLWEWLRRRSVGEDPAVVPTTSLFEQLCRAHGLTGDEERRLRDVAGEQGIDQPAVLFVDPRPFDHSPARSALEPLRQKLFGDAK
jgi:hypothetical protein